MKLAAKAFYDSRTDSHGQRRCRNVSSIGTGSGVFRARRPEGARWFGGYGFSGTMGFFTGMMYIPALLAVMAIAAEFLGGLGLIVGLLTRVAAFGIFCSMVVAVAMMHHQFGFFMSWAGTQKGEGFEFHFLVLAITAFLMIRGAGAASVDRLLSFPAKKSIPAKVRPQAA